MEESITRSGVLVQSPKISKTLLFNIVSGSTFLSFIVAAVWLMDMFRLNEFGRIIVIATGFLLTLCFMIVFYEQETKKTWETFCFQLKAHSFSNFWRSLGIGALTTMFVLTLLFFEVMIIEKQASLGWKVIIYPLFVLLQQFIFMWAPNIVFYWAPKWVRFLFCVISFGLVHNYYGPSFLESNIIIFSALSVGVPSAWACVYKEDYFAAFSYHILSGGIGLGFKIV